MSGSRVRFIRADEQFEVLGHGRFAYDGAGELGGPIATIGPAGIASLQESVRAWARYWGDEGHERLPIWVTETRPQDFDEDYSPVEQVSFEVGPRDFVVVVVAFLTDPSLDEGRVARILRPLLDRHRCRLVDVDVEGSGSQSWWRVRYAPPTRGRTLADAYAGGREVLALLEALEGTDLSLPRVADLIRGGKVDVLVGSKESSWLEAKSRGYDLTGPAGKVELAQDVARFANAEGGGLLVIGLRTRRRLSGDTISSVTPIELGKLNPRRYRAVIDRRVVPPVEGLEVEAIATEPGRGLMLITVPPQPEELKPFLVYGAIVADRVEGMFISIVRRRGEDSIPVTAAAIHSMLAAGRALMRKQPPPSHLPNVEDERSQED